MPADASLLPGPPVSPLRELVTLAAPTVAQMASYTVMQFIDAAVLARLGTEPPTAVGNAGFVGFSLMSFGMGVMFVVNAMASQEFGRRRFARCGRWMWQGVWFAVAFSLLLLPLIPFGGPIFRAFGHPESLVRQETAYLQIFLLVPGFKLVGMATGQYLLATGRPMASLVAAFAGVGANAVVVAPLALGKLGLPALGVVGAAWAQDIGVVVEAVVLLAYAFNGTSRRVYGATDWRLRPRTFAKLVRVGTGSGIQVATEVMAWSLFMVFVIARLGETAMAANQFMFRYMAISFMPAFGISQAVTALVGRSVGEGRPDLAFSRARLGYVVATTYMIACGIAFAVFRYPLMAFFTENTAVQHVGAILLVYAAVYQLFDAMNVIYTGALRGVADTFVPALVSGSLCWGFNVLGGSLITAYRPQWGVFGPWTLCTTYGLILAVFAMTRFRYGPWRRKLDPPTASTASTPRGFDVTLAPVPAAVGGLPTASE